MKTNQLSLIVKDALNIKNIQHIDVAFEVKQVKQITVGDEEFYEFEGYGSTFGNIDRVDDVMMAGCFTESLRKMTPVLLWQHEMNMPLGIFTEVTEDSKGLFVKGRMPKTDTFVSGRVVPQMKVGSVNKMSIGFTVPDRSAYEIDKGIRYIKKVDLFEISLVTIPANPEAGVTSNVKNFTFNEKQISFRDLHQLLAAEFNQLIDEEYQGEEDRPYAYIVDIFQDFFIAEIKDKLYRCNYTFNEDTNTVTIDPNKTEVRRQTEYVPITSETMNDNSNIEVKPKPYEEKQFTIKDVLCIKSKRDLEKLLRDSGLFSKSAAIFVSSFFHQSQSESVQVKSGKNTGILDQLKSLNSDLEKL